MRFSERKVRACLPRYWRDEVVSREPGWRSNGAIAWRGDGTPKRLRPGTMPPGWCAAQLCRDRTPARIVGDAYTSLDELGFVVEGDWGAVVVNDAYRPLVESCASLYLLDGTDMTEALMVAGADKDGEFSLFVMPLRPGAEQ